MGDREEKEFAIQLISLYREFPCLWKVKSKQYMDKNQRSSALSKMVEVLKKVSPNIDETEIKKKINIYRTNYKREHRKVQKSKLSGCSPDDLYVPKLWYFKELEFLEDQMDEDSGITTVVTDRIREVSLFISI